MFQTRVFFICFYQNCSVILVLVFPHLVKMGDEVRAKLQLYSSVGAYYVRLSREPKGKGPGYQSRSLPPCPQPLSQSRVRIILLCHRSSGRELHLLVPCCYSINIHSPPTYPTSSKRNSTTLTVSTRKTMHPYLNSKGDPLKHFQLFSCFQD